MEWGNDWATVSRAFLSHLLSAADRPFAILAAYRSGLSRAQNIIRNCELRGELNARKMGVHQLIGRWRGCQDPNIPYDECPPEKLVDVIERSYFVQKPPEMPQAEFVYFITNLGWRFDQNAIIISDGETVNIYKNDGSIEFLGRRPSLYEIGQGYSQHVKKSQVPFIFEGIEAPTSNIGRLAWRAAGLQTNVLMLTDLRDIHGVAIN